MSALDPIISRKIQLMSAFCTSCVVIGHAHNLTIPFSETARSGFDLIAYSTEHFVRFGLARLATPFFFAVAAFLLFIGAASVCDR